MAKLPGVYEPVDPSTYSKIYPDNPNPKITEIADLLIEWYQLLIDMRYIKASNVAFAPHKHLRVNTSEAARFGLSKDVVDLWQMMPYHTKHSQPDWNFGSDAGEFLFWGEFMDDMRGSEVDWWRNAADPFYWVDDLSPDWKQRPEDEHERGWEHERGPYMRPWYAALTNVGNHGSVMVLDTKTYNIWLIGQLDASNDPEFYGCNRLEDVKTTNGFDLNQYPSRPATEFLRDMISRFRSLEWIPGGLYEPTRGDSSDDKHYENYKELYQSCGWPDKFNPFTFDETRTKGGKKYSYWDYHKIEKAASLEVQKAYKPLNHLNHVMAVERTLIQDQIHAVDAEYRLKHENFDSEYERERLTAKKEMYQSKQEPEQSRWDDGQAQLRTELDFRTADLKALRMRTGRYSGLGYAGVSDEEMGKLYDDTVPAEQTRIAELEGLLRDKSHTDRLDRQYKEAKAAAATVPEDAWQALREENKTWENDEWKDRWSILGSGTSLVDVKQVLDEDYSRDELRREIVYALEKKEDRSWAGKRKWRNDGGVVAVAVHPEPPVGNP